VPDNVRSEGGWTALKLLGPFPFDQVGVLSSFVSPLAEAGISIFAISTFDTDYVLVKSDGSTRPSPPSSRGHRREEARDPTLRMAWNRAPRPRRRRMSEGPRGLGSERGRSTGLAVEGRRGTQARQDRRSRSDRRRHRGDVREGAGARAELGGYVSAMSADRRAGLMYCSMTLRVPVGRLDDAVNRLKALAQEIDARR
jgi:hypothetical protein